MRFLNFSFIQGPPPSSLPPIHIAGADQLGVVPTYKLLYRKVPVGYNPPVFSSFLGQGTQGLSTNQILRNLYVGPKNLEI